MALTGGERRPRSGRGAGQVAPGHHSRHYLTPGNNARGEPQGGYSAECQGVPEVSGAGRAARVTAGWGRVTKTACPGRDWHPRAGAGQGG